MPVNKTIATAFLAGLLVSSSFSAPASALEKSLKPQGPWALTKVDRTEQGGNSYCTLSRKYDDNIVLSLGRNQTEEYSLAIDFQKDVFDRDKSVKINLQPGPGQIRAYDMLPTSEKAVVIRLGWDTGFFDTLNQTRSMKVDIGGQAYAFAMPEVAKGQGELSDCMEGLKVAEGQGASPKATTDVLAAAPVAASADFSAGRVEDRIAAVKNAAGDVAAQEKAVLDNFANNMRAQEPGLRTGDSVFAADQRRENPELSAKARGAEKVAAATPAPRPPQKPATELAKRSAISDAAALAAIAPAAGGDANINKLQAENEALKKKTSAELTKSGEQVDALQKRLKDLAAENEALKKKYAQITPEVKKQMSAIEAERDELEERLVAAEQERAKLSVQSATIEDRTRQLEQRNAALEQELRLSQQAAQTSGARAEQMKLLQDRLAAIADENRKLKEAAGAVSPEAQKQLDALASEKSTLEQRLAATEKEKATLVPQQTVTAAETRAKEMAEQNEKLQQSLADLRAKVNESAKVQADAKAMENRIAAITAENETLKTAASGISPEAQKKIALAEIEKKDLEAKLAAAKAEAVKQVEIQKQVDEAVAAKKALEEKLAAAKSEVKSEAGKQTDSQQQIAALQAEKQALADQLKTAQADAAKKAKEISAQSATMTQIPGGDMHIQKAEADKKELQEKLAAAQERLKELETAPRAAVANAADSGKMKELEIRNKQLEESLRAAQIRISEAALNTESRALRTIADLELKLEAAQKDNANIAKQLESVRTQQEDGRLSLVAGDWSLEQATKRFNESEREIRRLGQQVEQERMACNREKSEIEKMLFDPAVTERKQLDRLRALETELEQARAKLAENETRVASAVTAPAVAPAAVEVHNIEPAAGGNMGAVSWNSKTPAANLAPIAATATADVEAERAKVTAQAATERRENERLRRELERAQAQNATYQNHIATMTKVPEATRDDEIALAAQLNQIQPTAGTVQAAPKPPAVKPAAQQASYNPSSIRAVLQKAGVASNGFKKASSGANGAENYTWAQGAGMTGLASVRQGGNFDAQVKQYIDGQKAGCQGDFASIPSTAPQGGKKASAYEIACVGSSGGSSSSIVFYEDQGKFVAIATQASAENMDDAMDVRDRIAGAL